MTLKRDGDDLSLRINGTTDELRVSSHFTNDATGGYQIEQIKFADNTVWDAAAIKLKALAGTTGNDVLNGGDGNDTLHTASGEHALYGGAGADHLSLGFDADESGSTWAEGGLGADTFLLRIEGIGEITLADFNFAQGDRLILAGADLSGLAPADLLQTAESGFPDATFLIGTTRLVLLGISPATALAQFATAKALSTAWNTPLRSGSDSGGSSVTFDRSITGACARAVSRRSQSARPPNQRRAAIRGSHQHD